jgi:hypothetical protein
LVLRHHIAKLPECRGGQPAQPRKEQIYALLASRIFTCCIFIKAIASLVLE